MGVETSPILLISLLLLAASIFTVGWSEMLKNYRTAREVVLLRQKVEVLKLRAEMITLEKRYTQLKEEN